MEVSRFGDPAPSVLFSRLAVTIERLTRTLSRPCSMYLVLPRYLSLIHIKPNDQSNIPYLLSCLGTAQVSDRCYLNFITDYVTA